MRAFICLSLYLFEAKSMFSLSSNSSSGFFGDVLLASLFFDFLDFFYLAVFGDRKLPSLFGSPSVHFFFLGTASDLLFLLFFFSGVTRVFLAIGSGEDAST